MASLDHGEHCGGAEILSANNFIDQSGIKMTLTLYDKGEPPTNRISWGSPARPKTLILAGLKARQTKAVTKYPEKKK